MGQRASAYSNDNGLVIGSMTTVSQSISVVDDESDEEVYFCNACDRVFTTAIDLNHHLTADLHHRSLVAHLEDSDDDEELQTVLCADRSFSWSPTASSSHVPVESASESDRDDESLYHCGLCNEIFRNVDSISDHISLVHRDRGEEEGQEIFHCNNCDTYFAFVEDLAIHRRTDCPAEVEDDEESPAYFVEVNEPEAQIREERETTSRSSSVQCPICLNNSNNPESLPCGHVYCSPCIQEALRADNRCPVCRTPMDL